MSAFLIGGSASAQDVPQEKTQKIELEKSQKLISGWNDRLDEVDTALNSDEITGRLLNESRSTVEEVTEGAATLQSSAADRLNRLNTALGKLGEPPAEGKTEAPAVAEERERLNKDIAEISGVIKQGELVDFRATEISDRLAQISRERFTRRILGRVDVPWDAESWGQVWSGAIELPDMVRSRYADLDLEGPIGDQLSEIAPGLVLLTFVVMAALIGGEVVVLRWLPERWRNAPKEDRVSLISGTRFVFTALVPGVALLVAYQMVDRQPDLLVGSMGDFVYQCFAALLFLLFVGAAIRSIYSPFSPGMRRAGTTETGSRVIGILSLFAAVIYASDLVLLQGATTLGTSLEIALVQSVSNVFLISIILFVSSLGVFWEHGGPDRHELWAKVERRLRRGLRSISILLPVLSVLGYVALARFILENLMMAMAFVTSYWLLRGYARALVHTYLVRPSSPDDDGTSDAVHGTLYFWLRVTIDVVMFTIAVPLAVLIFTDIAWADLLDAAEKAFIGIQVGGINFSLRAILIAILLFLAVLGVMRFFQRMLNTRVLPNTKLDQGLQHSVSAIFGYVGICLAVLLAISAAGMDLSNLAIIAGAISVGIGFGMQSIVSNFVSGLILLLERPIKVGDWIVVGAAVGLVILAVGAIFFSFRFVENERTREMQAWQIRLGIVADSRAAAIDEWIARNFAALKELTENASLQLYMTELELGQGDKAAITDEAAQATYLRNLLVASAARTGFQPPPKSMPTSKRRALQDWDSPTRTASPSSRPPRCRRSPARYGPRSPKPSTANRRSPTSTWEPRTSRPWDSCCPSSAFSRTRVRRPSAPSSARASSAQTSSTASSSRDRWNRPPRPIWCARRARQCNISRRWPTALGR